jgi:hypothetical protein
MSEVAQKRYRGFASHNSAKELIQECDILKYICVFVLVLIHMRM